MFFMLHALRAYAHGHWVGLSTTTLSSAATPRAPARDNWEQAAVQHLIEARETAT